MKLNLPKNQKYYYWTVIDLLASSASKHYKYEFNCFAEICCRFGQINNKNGG